MRQVCKKRLHIIAVLMAFGFVFILSGGAPNAYASEVTVASQLQFEYPQHVQATAKADIKHYGYYMLKEISVTVSGEFGNGLDKVYYKIEWVSDNEILVFVIGQTNDFDDIGTFKVTFPAIAADPQKKYKINIVQAGPSPLELKKIYIGEY